MITSTAVPSTIRPIAICPGENACSSNLIHRKLDPHSSANTPIRIKVPLLPTGSSPLESPGSNDAPANYAEQVKINGSTVKQFCTIRVMLDVRRMQILRAVVTSGSVTSAAGNLGYTPSAISQQLAVLEREAGTALLERV